MSAGTGVQHSEFNHSQEHELHLLQIWIFPEQKDLQPGYEQIRFSRDDKLNQLRLIGSHDGVDGSITIHQDVRLFASVLEAGNQVSHSPDTGRRVFIQVIEGSVTVNGETLSSGDGAEIKDERELSIAATTDAEFLLFDMA